MKKIPSSVYGIPCKRKVFRRVPLVDRYELDPWQRWRKYNAFPRTLFIHIFLVVLVTVQAVLVAQTSSNFSANIHNNIVTWFLPPDYVNNLVGNSLTFPGDEIFLHTTEELNTTLFSIFTTYFSLNTEENPLPPDHSDGSSTQILGIYGSPEYIDIYTSGKSTSIRPPSLTFTLSYNGEYHSIHNNSSSSSFVNDSVIPRYNHSSTTDTTTTSVTEVRPLQETVVFQTLDDFYAWIARALPTSDDLSHFSHSLLQLNADIQFRVYNFDADGITSNVCVLWDVGFIFDISARGTILVSIDDDFDTCDNGWSIDNVQGISPILISSIFLLISAVLQQILTLRECSRAIRLMLWSNNYSESIRYQIRKDRQRRYKLSLIDETKEKRNKINSTIQPNSMTTEPAASSTVNTNTLPLYNQVSRSSMSSVGIDDDKLDSSRSWKTSLPYYDSVYERPLSEEAMHIPLVQLGILPFLRILCTCSCYRIREETIFDEDYVREDMVHEPLFSAAQKNAFTNTTVFSSSSSPTSFPAISPVTPRSNRSSSPTVYTTSSSNPNGTGTSPISNVPRSTSASPSLRTNTTIPSVIHRNRSTSSATSDNNIILPNRIQSMAQTFAIVTHNNNHSSNHTNDYPRRQSTVSNFTSSTVMPYPHPSTSSPTADGGGTRTLRTSSSGVPDGTLPPPPPPRSSTLPRNLPFSQNEYALHLANTYIDTSFDSRKGPILGINRIQRRHRLEVAIQQFRKMAQVVNGTHIMELFSPWLVVSFIGETLNIIYAIYCIMYGEISVPVEIDVLLGLGAALEWTVIVKYVRHYGHLSIFERAMARAIPSVIRNLIATVPIFAAFVVLQCMISGNLTERFDGLQWSSIALFAVANGDVVRETFQVTLQYQPNVPMQWIAQIVLYGYVIIVIYALLKTTTAITEEAFLLTRPSPGNTNTKNSDDEKLDKEANDEKYNTTFQDTNSVSSNTSSTTAEALGENNFPNYYLQSEVRNFLLAMQEVYDAGGSIKALVNEAVATVPLHAKYWLFSDHHHSREEEDQENTDTIQTNNKNDHDNTMNVPEMETNIQEYLEEHKGASITSGIHRRHPQDTMIEEEDTNKVRLLINHQFSSTGAVPTISTENQLRSLKSIRILRTNSSQQLVIPSAPRPSTLFQDIGQWIQYGAYSVIFGITKNSDADILGEPNELEVIPQPPIRTTNSSSSSSSYGTVRK